MFIARLIAGIIQYVILFALLLFAPAGTVRWWRAWVLLGALSLCLAIHTITLYRVNKDLLVERTKSRIQKGQPRSDRILLLSFIISWVLLIPFAALDVSRLRLMGRPGPFVSTAGILLFLASWVIVTLALRENAFAAPVVRLQEERGQKVVDTGLYAFVRHPMYAGVVLWIVGVPLWLESYAGALLAAVPIAVLALRIVFEERFLRRELPGYEAYTGKVRYRLVPYLW